MTRSDHLFLGEIFISIFNIHAILLKYITFMPYYLSPFNHLNSLKYFVKRLPIQSPKICYFIQKAFLSFGWSPQNDAKIKYSLSCSTIAPQIAVHMKWITNGLKTITKLAQAGKPFFKKYSKHLLNIYFIRFAFLCWSTSYRV